MTGATGATCANCNRTDLPVKPWCRSIAVAHVSPAGHPCREFSVTDVDVARANRALEEEWLWV